MPSMVRVGIVLVICVGFAAAAHATVGGASRIEMLGHDPRDGKVYFLQGTNLELDALHFIRLDGARAGEPVFVKSYYHRDGLESTDAEAFDRRLSKLRKRLSKIEPARSSRREVDESTPRPALPGYTMKRTMLKRWKDELYEVPCRTVKLDIEKASTSLGATATLDECFYARGRYRVTKAYAIPNQPIELVVLAGVPDPFEGGYVTERLVLLR